MENTLQMTGLAPSLMLVFVGCRHIKPCAYVILEGDYSKNRTDLKKLLTEGWGDVGVLSRRLQLSFQKKTLLHIASEDYLTCCLETEPTCTTRSYNEPFSLYSTTEKVLSRQHDRPFALDRKSVV